MKPLYGVTNLACKNKNKGCLATCPVHCLCSDGEPNFVMRHREPVGNSWSMERWDHQEEE